MSINSSTITGGTPTLMVHSFHETTNPAWYPAIIRLQTENYTQPTSNLFGYNSIEFWSNHYDSTYQWQVGAITSFSNTIGPFEDSSNYYGGLKLSCSGGPSRIEAKNGPVDVMYLINKKVGIWQSDPKEKLHVGGFIRSDSLRGVGLRQVFANDDGTLITDGTPGIQCPKPWCLYGNELTTNDGSEYLGSSNSFSLIFKTNSTEVLRLNPTSNGINNNVVMELKMNEWNQYPEIDFGYRNDNPSIRLYRATGVGENCSGNEINTWWIENWTGSDTLWDAYGALHFDVSPSAVCKGSEEPITRMALLRNGNIGIGTINPKQRLHVIGKAIIGTLGVTTGDYANPELAVDGTIVAKEVVVTDGEEWGDFVFKDNYNLLSLEQLNKKIKKLGHLPGIPSAKEINSNGVNVRNMQNKLLQKIEEITLYIIKLNKENQQLNKKIHELECSIK